jgi:hypothetical protein
MKLTWLFLSTFLTTVIVVAENGAQEAMGTADSLRRAGSPQETSRLALPSNGPGSFGYNVGGGSLAGHRGDGPLPDDGTWGWDYKGLLLPRKVNLLWWHGRRNQGGTGAYKTDGPKLPPLHESSSIWDH